MVATGSPRKRFDKAAKIPARALIPFNEHSGEPVMGHIRAQGEDDLVEKIEGVLAK
jgi:histidyl-tRNA synthetase